MRFGHKAATRRHILDVASKCFRRDGAAAAGIAGIMGEAGLTNGAFYAHFDSKDALVREALTSALADQQHRLEEDKRTGLDLEGAIRKYLNRGHLDDRAGGVPLGRFAAGNRPPASARSADLRRRAAKLRFDASLLPDAGSAASARRATAIFALMVGTLQLARAVPDAAQAEQILEGGVEAALRLGRMPSP